MKFLFAILCSLIMTQANAATGTVKTNATSATGAVYESARTTGVSLYYSLGNEFNLNATGMKAKFNSTNPIGFGVQKNKIVKSDLGYHVGMFFEFGHSADSLTVNNIRMPIGDDKTFSYLFVDPSATYGLNKNVYLIGGLNYSIPTSEIATISVKGDLGYQVGAGYQVNNQWSIEGLYREINFRAGTSDGVNNIDFDEARISGLLLKANFSIQ